MSVAVRLRLPRTTSLPLRWERGLSRLRQHGFGYTILGLIVVLVGGPLGAGLGMSLHKGLPGRAGPLSLENFQTAYLDPTLLEILGNTMSFAGGTVLVSVFLGAMGWILMFSPEIGLANALAKAIFGLKEAPFSIYNIPGMSI